MLNRICREHRRGAVVALVAVSATLMAGVAALTIDLGNVYVARAELQRVADASALAGASVYFTDAAVAGRTCTLASAAVARSKAVAEHNAVQGDGLTLRASDLAFGRHDFGNPESPLSSIGPWNAVQVTAARTGGSADGPVSLMFARIWGKDSTSLTATARAAADDRLSGYELLNNMSGTKFMPFAIPEQGYYSMLRYGPDKYSYNGGVDVEPDGIREVQMYPWKWTLASGDLGDDGSGNFGVLNVGRASQGLPDVVMQITYGITPNQMTTTFGTSTLTFYDVEHTQQTGPNIYWVSGDPGLSVAMEKALSQQIGQVYGFFLHRGVVVNGSNSMYAVSGIFFARLVDVDLESSWHAGGLVVQPVGYTDSWVKTSKFAASTYGTVGRVTLVR